MPEGAPSPGRVPCEFGVSSDRVPLDFRAGPDCAPSEVRGTSRWSRPSSEQFPGEVPLKFRARSGAVPIEFRACSAPFEFRASSERVPAEFQEFRSSSGRARSWFRAMPERVPGPGGARAPTDFAHWFPTSVGQRAVPIKVRAFSGAVPIEFRAVRDHGLVPAGLISEHWFRPSSRKFRAKFLSSSEQVPVQFRPGSERVRCHWRVPVECPCDFRPSCARVASWFLASSWRVPSPECVLIKFRSSAEHVPAQFGPSYDLARRNGAGSDLVSDRVRIEFRPSSQIVRS